MTGHARALWRQPDSCTGPRGHRVLQPHCAERGYRKQQDQENVRQYPTHRQVLHHDGGGEDPQAHPARRRDTVGQAGTDWVTMGWRSSYGRPE